MSHREFGESREISGMTNEGANTQRRGLGLNSGIEGSNSEQYGFARSVEGPGEAKKEEIPERKESSPALKGESRSEGKDVPLGEIKEHSNKPEELSTEVKSLYRGSWIDGKLEEGTKIPVAGFDTSSPTKLVIDTEWMQESTKNFTSERLSQSYKKNKGALENFVTENNIPLDAQTLYTFLQVQRKTDTILAVDPIKIDVPERDNLYESAPGEDVALSRFVGIAKCTESASVGKTLFDHLEIPSTLMVGVHVDSKNAEQEKHAFLISDDSQSEGSLVFDISRPHTVSGVRYPRILRSERKLTYDTFKDKDNYVVPATDVYTGKTLYFGVAHSKNVIDESPIHFADE